MSTKYTADGHEVHVNKPVDGGFIVERVYQGEAYTDEGQQVQADLYGERVYMDADELFDKPPKAKVDPEVAELRELAKSIKQEIVELRQKRQEARDELRRAEMRPARIAALDDRMRDLEMFLEKGISHVVIAPRRIYRYGRPRLVAAAELKHGDYLDLVSFKLDSNGGRWVIVKGYGSDQRDLTIAPFASEADAILYYRDSLSSYQTNTQDYGWRDEGQRHIDECAKYDAEPNAEWLAKYTAKCAAEDAAEAEKKREQLAKLQAELGEQA